MAIKRDDTFVQLMLRYIDKTFAQTCRYPGEILQLQSNRVENIDLSEFCKHTSKTGNLSYIKLKRFARLLQMLSVTKFGII